MAKNYTIKEAVEIIVEGNNAAEIVDIGRRFPLLLEKVSKISAKAPEEIKEFMGFMPDYLTANKVNSSMKKALLDGEDGEVEDTVADAKPSKKVTAKDAAKETDGEVDYNKFNGDTLIKMCKERGIYKKGMKKAELVAAMENYDANGDSDEDEETDENPYAGKSAMELYKECKKRGIKAAPKKKADFYANLLIEADNAETEEDDDWEEEEEVEVTKPAKTTKGKGKPAKKTEPVDDDDDDDDDWDI